MEPYLLAAKLRVPPQPFQSVSRGRLTAVLERGLPRHKLALLAAPAGYGKTTLLSQWARQSSLAVVWLSLAREENDLERFLRCLLSAWEAARSTERLGALSLLLEGKLRPEAALSELVNAAQEVAEHSAIVLDDYHLIEAAAVHEAVAFLLEHLPPQVHLLLSSRSEPPLPLARLRARQELLELDSDDLRFSLAEAATFLSYRGAWLEPEQLEQLHAQVEGWAAGLQLASLSLERRSTAAGFRVSGRQRFVADYLQDEVLARLPERSTRFLLQTSILERLCGPLCQAVTGEEASQEMLEALERDNLFVQPLDDSRTWFRYHGLFAQCLQVLLERRMPGAVTTLHRRAGRWHLERDFPEEALRHAIAGDDLDLAVKLGERYFEVKLLSGEFRLLSRWFEALPEQWYAAYPSIGLMRAGVLMFTGAFEAGIRSVNEIEQELLPAESEEAHWHLARVTAIRCSIACMQNDLVQAERYADRALEALPSEDYAFRAGIHHALGDSYRRNGRWHEARECYLRVLELTGAPTLRIRSVHVLGGLADLELRQGRLRAAARYWRQAFAALEQRETVGNFPLPLLGWLHLRLGEILYEWNELDEAEERLSQGLERAELGGDARVLVSGYLSSARLKLTQGDIAAAEAYLERARSLVENVPDPEWLARLGRVQLELWLAQDRLRAAADWADALLRSEERPAGDVAQLALARVLIVKGDEPSLERALAQLKPLLETTEKEGRLGVHVEVLALQALARWRRGDQTGALTSLAPALRLAEPEGYVRLFADLGPSMVRLLQEARARKVVPEYVETLLAACSAPPSPGRATEALPERLTAREQEVLEQLAAGLTNREIAGELNISSETVKKHAGSIYGKLSVGNRTQAVAKARELALLE